MSVNKSILVGNVGKNPEIRIFENGDKLASFSIATSESYINKLGKKVTNTEWHSISASGKLVEIIETYIIKGMQLYIEGSIRYRSYDDMDGNKKYVTEIRAYTIQMLGKKPEHGNNELTEKAPENDVPF